MRRRRVLRVRQVRPRRPLTQPRHPHRAPAGVRVPRGAVLRLHGQAGPDAAQDRGHRLRPQGQVGLLSRQQPRQSQIIQKVCWQAFTEN